VGGSGVGHGVPAGDGDELGDGAPLGSGDVDADGEPDGDGDGLGLWYGRERYGPV
jgi:hypothetical protein